jgi:tetratricopeptide (TPR) repeat protein
MYDEYVDRENSEEAYFHGSLAERYGLRFDGDDSNNFGYVALSLGHLEEAKGLFLDAVRSYEEMPYLPMYNLAMVLAKSWDISGAITHLERAMEKAKDVPKTKRTASCLFAPIVRDGSLDLVEKRGHVDVWEMAKEGIAFLKQHCATKS